MRHVIAVTALLALVSTTAGVADHLWHQWHCRTAFRSANFVTLGSHQYGVAEYSYRHTFPNAPLLPDPRDVFIYVGPAGRFLLSNLLVWLSALLAAGVCVIAFTRRTTTH